MCLDKKNKIEGFGVITLLVLVTLFPSKIEANPRIGLFLDECGMDNCLELIPDYPLFITTYVIVEQDAPYVPLAWVGGKIFC